MNNKKRVVVLFLAVVTMLMVIGNVAFAAHIVDRWEDCEYKDGEIKCCEKVRYCRDINDRDTCWVEPKSC